MRKKDISIPGPVAGFYVDLVSGFRPQETFEKKIREYGAFSRPSAEVFLPRGTTVEDLDRIFRTAARKGSVPEAQAVCHRPHELQQMAEDTQILQPNAPKTPQQG